ncbi:MAG: uridine kinase [Eubacteriales bacterium]|nr:uridine kinase [Eubacteriales bacterium]
MEVTGPGNIRPAVIAIDGMCGAGKSFFAQTLKERLGAAVIHMDDFFLPPELRTEARRAEPGGNVDYGRFLTEVIEPLRRMREKGVPEAFSYRRFDCSRMAFSEEAVLLPAAELFVVEGSYSLREEFCQVYDLKIFLRCSEETQKARIIERNGAERYEDFRDLWIPLEEAYFKALHVPERADLVLGTD